MSHKSATAIRDIQAAVTQLEGISWMKDHSIPYDSPCRREVTDAIDALLLAEKLILDQQSEISDLADEISELERGIEHLMPYQDGPSMDALEDLIAVAERGSVSIAGPDAIALARDLRPLTRI